jgi:predicted DNA-binding transcriptional regulator AlpA
VALASFALNRCGNIWPAAPRNERRIPNGKNPMKLIKEKEVLEMFQFSARHLRELRHRKLIPYYQIGRSIRYCVADVESALQRLKVEAHK